MGKRNPNGYGCVTKLKGNRSRPWCVKVTIYDAEGRAKQAPIGYAETEEKANILLAQYNNNPWNIDREKVTLLDLYHRWEKIKLPKLGKSSQSCLRSAFKHCSKYYGMKYRNIRSYHMQESIDNCGCGYATQGHIKSLWGHLDEFAFEIDLIDKMYSQITTSPPASETSRTPFTTEQIDTIWEIKDQPYVDTILIFLYTGFRIEELLTMTVDQVNLDEWYFQGGIKSASGKNRIVPIHDRIKPLVKNLVNQGNTYLFSYDGKKFNATTYRNNVWYKVLEQIAPGKTPHEARHTFETFLDDAKGNRKCIDMLMGHKSKDVGNRVYNHKTLDQLRETIALLK